MIQQQYQRVLAGLHSQPQHLSPGSHESRAVQLPPRSERKYILAEYLINNGAEPFTDYYLPNSLEIALSILRSTGNKEENLKLVNLIKILSEKGLTIRGTIKDNGDLRMLAPRIWGQFSADKMAEIDSELNLSISSLSLVHGCFHPLIEIIHDPVQ